MLKDHSLLMSCLEKMKRWIGNIIGATKTSAIRIELINQKTTTPRVRERSENRNLPHPEGSESQLQGVRRIMILS
jgi:hypothetical protein